MEAKKIPYFELTISGTYYSELNGVKSVQPYRHENIKISSEKVKEEGFIPYTVGKVLPKIFTIVRSSEYSDYRGLRTWKIEGSIKEINGAKLGAEGSDFSLKSREQLEEYVRVVGVPIDTDLITDDSALRELLRIHKEENHRFIREYEAIIHAQKDTQEFLELNTDVGTSTKNPFINEKVKEDADPVADKIKFAKNQRIKEEAQGIL